MNFYFTSLKKNHQHALTMINELFENLPTEIAFMILTYQPNKTAVMIKKAFPYASNFNCKRPSQMKESLLTKFLKMKLLLKEFNYLIDFSNSDFYGCFFDWAIEEYISEGFYIMDENRKPPRVNVGHSRDSRYESDDDDDDE